MELLEKQFLFARLFTKLIQKVFEMGYEITFGEAHRPPETAALYAKEGRGIKNSLHTLRLAFDINLFKNGKYLNQSEDYRWLGEIWESLGELYQVKTMWGGRFKKPDGNHFSIAHEGRA